MKTKFQVWRKKKGLTIDDLHDATQIGTATLYKWDSGVVKPSRWIRQAMKEEFPDCPI